MDQTIAPQTAPQHGSRKLTIMLAVVLGLAIITIVVLATLLAANPDTSATRTVSVTGDAKLTAVPDEYAFYPSYTFRNTDKDAALAELTKKSDEVVAGLKKAGVADSAIKTNSSGYDMPVYYDSVEPTTGVTAPGSAPIRKEDAAYNLQLTVTVRDKALAQKVQDYLVTTSPSGGVSPQASFSDAKRKQLESQARDSATKDARGKADQSAKNLGFRVGKVQSVNDGSGFGVMPYEGKAMASDSAMGPALAPTLSVNPGENELSYSVTVVYEIR